MPASTARERDGGLLSEEGEIQMSPKIDVRYDHVAYLQSLSKSKEWFERARAVEPAGVQGAGRYYPPQPIFISKAKGARLWDVDGNEYIDFHNSYGPSFLGYADDRVAAAVTDTLQNEGVLYALPHPREVRLAETLVRLLPSAEKVIFTCEGTTAIYHAVRASRAYSGKVGILKFEGSYHGWYDDVNASVSPRAEEAGPADRPNVTGGSAGRLPEAMHHIYVAPWNDLDATRTIARQRKDEIGVVILEPVQRYILPTPGFLEGIRALCDEINAVLLFDEIYTGFRPGMGCAQARFGVTPDVTVIGKAMGNGYPIAAAVGKKEILSLLAPEGPVFFSGTHNGSICLVRAAQETLRILEDERVADVVNAKGEKFAQSLNEGIRQMGVPVCVTHWWSNWWLYLRPTPPTTYRDVIHLHSGSGYPVSDLTLDYTHFMLANRVYIQPFMVIRALINYAITEADLERTAELTLAWLEKNARRIEHIAKNRVDA